ncbi:MAG TPA: Hsp20/alpha crystallin family protein [Saprospiraceae bacterium]|nr:Hsp20/alpha crystallin family protein [Saprospiraceae bacterium]
MFTKVYYPACSTTNQEQIAKTSNKPAQAKLNVIQVNDSQWKLELALPGFTKEQIDLEIKDQLLIIKAKKEESAQEGKMVYREINHVNQLERSIQLSSHIDMNAIQAEMKNGLLTINLTAKAGLKKQIEVL